MDDEPTQSFPCTHCGAQHPFSVRLVEQYAGNKVTRWCVACQELFDVEFPPKEEPSA